MARTQRRPFGAQEDPADVDLDALLAQLTDEAEHWKTVADGLERAVGELRAERRELEVERERAEAWRRGLAAELVELGQATALDRDPRAEYTLAGFLIALASSLLLWGLVGLVVYGGYRLFGG